MSQTKKEKEALLDYGLGVINRQKKIRLQVNEGSRWRKTQPTSAYLLNIASNAGVATPVEKR